MQKDKGGAMKLIGFDTVDITKVKIEHKGYVLINPNQIVSIDNTGAFYSMIRTTKKAFVVDATMKDILKILHKAGCTWLILDEQEKELPQGEQ